MKTDIQKINCLTSDLSNLLEEFKLGNLTEELLVDYYAEFLESANVDLAIIINTLEKFGEIGKNRALCIKVNYGL